MKEEFLKQFLQLEEYVLDEDAAIDKAAVLFKTIKSERKKAKLTQTELGNLARVSRRTISCLESGEKESISFAALLRICDILKIDIFEWTKRDNEFERLKRMNATLIRYVSSLEHDFGVLKNSCEF